MDTIYNSEDAAGVAASLNQVRACPKPGKTEKKPKPLQAKKQLQRKARIKIKQVSREFPVILAFAENVEKCTSCGEISDTIVAAHYSGMHSHELGKGMSVKGSDLFIAYVCGPCHDDFDNPELRKDEIMSHRFMLSILRSQVLLLKAGVIGVVEHSEELQGEEEE